MTQSELTEKFNELQNSKYLMENWSAVHHFDIDVLRRSNPDTMWTRRRPTGQWIEVPGTRKGPV